MAKSQIDFSALYFDSLGGPPEPIRYELRDGSCLLHDIAFLNSLIHDARALNPNANATDGKFALQINRDCWELGYTKHGIGLELHIADSTLDFTGVDSVLWRFDQPDPEPWVDYLWVDRLYRTHRSKTFHLILANETWECAICLNRDEWSATMQDREMPYLWSSRNPR